jgi:uncharacterized protein
MKLPDSNVLLSACNAASSEHGEALRWLDTALSASEPLGFAHTTLLAFLRISTNPRIFPRPLDLPAAFGRLEDWLQAPPAVIVEPGDGYLVRLKELLSAGGTAGDLTTDAHLAAIAIERSATVVSFDSDFRRFEGLSFEHLG